MSEEFDPVARAIQVVARIEEDWANRPSRAYLLARERVAEALRGAYAEGFQAGRLPRDGGAA